MDHYNLPVNPLAFTDNLKFGVATIDRQHRRMVQIVNHLLTAVIDGALGEAEDHLLDELVRLAAHNFRTEEEWMRRCNYENGTRHAESHAHLLQELVALRDGLFTRHEHLNRKVVFFIRRWLEQHLLHSDRELADAIRKQVKPKGTAKLSPPPR
jgi:hemerythrin-like metal-binding protein